MTMPELVKKIAMRAEAWSRELGLAGVFPDALFVVAYEADREVVEDVLRRAGLDPAAYCRRVVEEVRQLPRAAGRTRTVPWHKASIRLLEASAGDENPVRGLVERLLVADGVSVLDRTADEGDPFEELEALVGLGCVKEEVRKLVELVKFTAARRAKGLEAGLLTSHFVFTGNPGTGKTTVARLLARIYRKMGVLKKGHLVEVDRAKLVAGYVGQSAIQTNAVIDAALDGVLFIDEAYSLVSGGTADYGAEVIATLLKQMEDARERLIVIVAGYTHEMASFVRSNPGLESRFTKFIEFPDYSSDELVSIFGRMAQGQQYVLSDSARDRVRERIVRTLSTGELSGNARFVRNLFQQTKERMASRVVRLGNATKRQLQTIEAEDIA